MKTMFPFALAISLFSSLAMAEDRQPKKPSVCVDFAVYGAPGAKPVGVCRDGKRARIFTSWTTVELDGQRYTVGR